MPRAVQWAFWEMSKKNNQASVMAKRPAVSAIACWIKKQINKYNSKADVITKCILPCLSDEAFEVFVQLFFLSSYLWHTAQCHNKGKHTLSLSALLKLSDCESLSKL